MAPVGRPDVQNDILREWGELVEYVDVSADRTTADIEAYIMQEVDKVQMLRSKRLSKKDKNNLRQLIVGKLLEGAGGMFQWIKLVLAEITHKKVKTDIALALKAVPTDLLEMIGRIFDRVTKHRDIPQDYLREMLLWIACAKRPLTLNELQQLIHFTPRERGKASSDAGPGESEEKVNNDWPDLETDLRTTFASFLTLTRADGKTTETLQKERVASLNWKREDDDGQGSEHVNENENEPGQSDISEEDGGPSSEFRGEFDSNQYTTEIQFTHASIRDFLFRKQSLMPGSVRIDKNQAHAHIAIGCLLHFTDNGWGMMGKDGRAPSSYAYIHWIDHLNQANVSKVQLEDRTKVLKLLFGILHDPGNAYRFFEIGICLRDESFQETGGTLLQVTSNWTSEDVLSTLSSEERSWITKATRSLSNLFKVVASIAAQMWLQTWNTLYFHESRYYMELLYACFPLVCSQVFFVAILT